MNTLASKIFQLQTRLSTWPQRFVKMVDRCFLKQAQNLVLSSLLKLHLSPACGSMIKVHMFRIFQEVLAFIPISSIPILILLDVFSYQPHPQRHIQMFLPGEEIRSNIEVKWYKMCLKRQGQSHLKAKNTSCQNGHIAFPFLWVCSDITLTK